MYNANEINILHLRCSFNPGGVEKIIQDLMHSNSPDPTKKVRHILAVLKEEINEDLIKELSTKHKVYVFKTKDFNSPKLLFHLLKIVIDEKINILHSNDTGSMKWASICKFFNPGLKLVNTVHSCNIISIYSKKERFFAKKFINMHIAVSESILSEFKNNAIYNSIKIYNGIDVKKFKPKELNDELINKEKFNLVNVGWLRIPIKGQDVLLKALGECKKRGLKFSCDFIGGYFDEDSHNCVQKLVEDNDIKDEVNFLGIKNNIAEELKKYDIFILPSRSEGISLALLEAMASRLTIIASNIDGPSELIKNDVTGLLFENENHSDLADKILYLYNNKDKMSILANNAYEFAQNFDISIMHEKYYALYNNLLEKTVINDQKN